MNRRSDEAAEAILSALPAAQRERLVTAMGEVYRLLKVAGVRIERADPASREARWCLEQYYAELARRFDEGFDAARSLPTDDAELRPPRGVFLMASVDGEPVACGLIKTIGPGIGYLKRMWVSDALRGVGF